MAWCRLGDKPLSEPVMVSILTYICLTRPQWFRINIYVHVCVTSSLTHGALTWVLNVKDVAQRELTKALIPHLFRVCKQWCLWLTSKSFSVTTGFCLNTNSPLTSIGITRESLFVEIRLYIYWKRPSFQSILLPIVEMRPQIAHTMRQKPTEPDPCATPLGEMKMPDPEKETRTWWRHGRITGPLWGESHDVTSGFLSHPRSPGEENKHMMTSWPLSGPFWGESTDHIDGFPSQRVQQSGALMTSWHGNAFRIAVKLLWETTDHHNLAYHATKLIFVWVTSISFKCFPWTLNTDRVVSMLFGYGRYHRNLKDYYSAIPVIKWLP